MNALRAIVKKKERSNFLFPGIKELIVKYINADSQIDCMNIGSHALKCNELAKIKIE